MKGEPELMLEMLSNSQPSVTFLLTGRRKSHIVQMQVLRQAQAEAVRHVERRWPFFRMRIVRVLAGTLSHGARDPVPPITMLVSSIDLLQV